MDYFVIILLTLIIFTFLSDKKVLNIKEVANRVDKLESKIDNIYSNVIIFDIENNLFNNIDEVLKYVLKKLDDTNKRYIVLKNKNINLSDDLIKIIIANYIKENKKASVFMPSYEYKYMNHKTIKDIWKELNIVGYNYLNIFSKSAIKTFGVIIMKTKELQSISHKDFIRFSPNNEFKVELDKKQTNKVLKNVTKTYNGNFKVIIKSWLLMFVGTTVTTNLIGAIYVFNIDNIITAVVVYWCYSYVLNYMYNPIGKYKIISKYLLPVFLVIYLFLQIINIINKNIFRNKKVHAS